MKTGIALLLAISMATPTAAVKYRNCDALNAKYPYGVAINVTSARTASGLTGRPKVDAKLYQANASKDRDRDGVACES